MYNNLYQIFIIKNKRKGLTMSIIFGGQTINGYSVEEEKKVFIEGFKIVQEHSDTIGCPICENEDKNDVRVRINPYMDEINHILEPMYSCLSCWRENANEI